MRYSGSKRKYMRDLMPFLMNGTDENTVFYDCFGGGMNVISEIPLKNKVACDTNKYVIALWNEIKENGAENIGLPTNSDELTREMYDDVKKHYLNNDGKYPDYYIGFVGACCSYGGAWFNGYASYNTRKKEDHIKEAYRGLVKQAKNFKNLENTKFIYSSYDNIDFNDNCVVFCDPPYMGTKKYESDFDHTGFWEWAKKQSKSHKRLYITEYDAPESFKCIWSKDKSDGMGTTITGRKQRIKTEKLFIYYE